MSPGNAEPLWRRATFLLATVLLVTAMPALAGETTVAQKDRAFATGQIRIRPGDRVHFSNEDDFTHQIYVESPGFSYESDEQEPGRTLDVTFPHAGSYDVRCHIHPKMRLRVDVR